MIGVMYVIAIFLGTTDDIMEMAEIFIPVSMIIPAIILYYSFKEKRYFSLKLRHARSFKNMGIGALLGILAITASFLIIWLFGGVKVVAIHHILADASFWRAVVLFLLVALGEELFSRGYIYNLVKTRYTMPIGIIVSSILFALMHAANPAVWGSLWPMLNIFLAGVVLALIYEVFQSLWAAIGFHFTWNLLQGNIFGFEVSGGSFGTSLLEIKKNSSSGDWLTGGAFGIEGSAVSVFILIIFTIILVRKIRTAKN
ncbi:CPBP family intramembrane metalloprotease [Listeria weihenstephanensis]|uniref:CPBP family intramembrane metalloprotease n=1 Tax=Listeria weihenstephanensis TaxID=1006155 RepID=A0A841Z900_9LIST|nr:CPBP family intramembrane metalloprotease [Listeria weihenstephanensis]